MGLLGLHVGAPGLPGGSVPGLYVGAPGLCVSVPGLSVGSTPGLHVGAPVCIWGVLLVFMWVLL